MILTIGGLFILVGELGSLLARLIPLPWGLIEPFYEAVSTDPLGAIFAIVIVAPLAEEMLFRGLILRGFLNRYTFRRSIIVSALLFGAVHENLWQLPSAVIIGLLLAWWFAKTRSLWPCVLGHALFNGLGVFWLHVDRLRGGTITSTMEFLPLWIDLAAGAAVVLGIWLLVRMFPSADWEPDAVTGEGFPQPGDQRTEGVDEDVWKST
jgi:membrane protease YdiL (CAAX protease family)